MRLAVLCLCLLPLAAACKGREVTPGPARDEQARPAEPRAAAQPLDEPPSFVGVWAARPDLCANGAWMFTAQGVRTAGETTCTWSKVSKTESGYTLTGDCSAEGRKSRVDVMLLLDPTQPGQMIVTGGPWDVPITLGRCNGPANAAPAAPPAPAG
ncbi:hypothetical protein [Caulobacter sp. 17J80-11]|uniref:hypothetical protein n=1 Tax=Caulobacter sp. 17J80-11 TaxID=2763502 RepID=UPI0016536C98|nr:hypothetical protein [Caulobacter sp. 17J80-11]MBC6980421.1 hypothetical protein [Caulobacter sp. 17J80-11]